MSVRGEFFIRHEKGVAKWEQNGHDDERMKFIILGRVTMRLEIKSAMIGMALAVGMVGEGGAQPTSFSDGSMDEKKYAAYMKKCSTPATFDEKKCKDYFFYKTCDPAIAKGTLEDPVKQLLLGSLHQAFCGPEESVEANKAFLSKMTNGGSVRIETIDSYRNTESKLLSYSVEGPVMPYKFGGIVSNIDGSKLEFTISITMEAHESGFCISQKEYNKIISGLAVHYSMGHPSRPQLMGGLTNKKRHMILEFGLNRQYGSDPFDFSDNFCLWIVSLYRG